MKYLISYDLRESGKNYAALITALIHRFKAVRVLRSQWLLNSNLTAKQILDQLRMLTDNNDGILVIEVPADGDVAYYGLHTDQGRPSKPFSLRRPLGLFAN